MSQKLGWRYATQDFDTEKKLSKETLDAILNAGIMAPSSFGLQPWKFVVVKDAETRAKIRAAAWDQKKITESSDLLVLASLKEATPEYIDSYVKDVSEKRGVPVDALKGYRDMMVGSATAKGSTEEWNARQTYIATGFVLFAAMQLGVDAAPMEGFDPAKVDEILGLAGDGYTSRVIVSLGYRNPNDEALKRAKVRFDADKVVKTV